MAWALGRRTWVWTKPHNGSRDVPWRKPLERLKPPERLKPLKRWNRRHGGNRLMGKKLGHLAGNAKHASTQERGGKKTENPTSSAVVTVWEEEERYTWKSV